MFGDMNLNSCILHHPFPPPLRCLALLPSPTLKVMLLFQNIPPQVAHEGKYDALVLHPPSTIYVAWLSKNDVALISDTLKCNRDLTHARQNFWRVWATYLRISQHTSEFHTFLLSPRLWYYIQTSTFFILIGFCNNPKIFHFHTIQLFGVVIVSHEPTTTYHYVSTSIDNFFELFVITYNTCQCLWYEGVGVWQWTMVCSLLVLPFLLLISNIV